MQPPEPTAANSLQNHLVFGVAESTYHGNPIYPGGILRQRSHLSRVEHTCWWAEGVVIMRLTMQSRAVKRAVRRVLARNS